MILGIIIGILIWNVVCCIAVSTIYNDDTIITISCGIVGGACILLDKIFYAIKRFIKNLKYCSALIDPNGKPCYCKCLLYAEQFALFNKGYKWNEELCNKYTSLDGWDFEVCCGYIVNLRYTPIKIAKAEGSYKIKNLRKILKTT